MPIPTRIRDIPIDFFKYFYIGLMALTALGLLSAASSAQACTYNRWSQAVGTAGLSASAQRSYAQSCGLRVTVNDTASHYVEDQTPTNEARYITRFYAYLGNLSIAANNEFVLFAGYNSASTVQFRLIVRNVSGQKRLFLEARNGAGLTRSSGGIVLTDVWHAFEMDWSPSAMTIKLDNVTQPGLSGLSNAGATIDKVRMGAVDGTTASITGFFDLDEFVSQRSGTVGLLATNEMRNISSRSQIGTGGNIMIAGFIINGNTPKTVLLRGRGPSINIASGKLANPYMDLVNSGGTVIATNDNWGSAANSADITATGLAPTNSLESAILVTLNPGAYTTRLSGISNTTGIGIIEVFDVDIGTPRLANISTRSQVGTGSDILIAGLIIDGTSPKTILLRGRGPSINIPSGKLANPYMDLVNSSGTVVAANNDWGNAANSAAITATGLAPTNAQEAAILITLNPGAYTTRLSGVNNTTGIGIVEAFDVNVYTGVASSSITDGSGTADLPALSTDKAYLDLGLAASQALTLADLPAALSARLTQAQAQVLDLSADPTGERIVFSSAQALLDSDRNGMSDVYLYDAASDTLQLLSITAAGQAALGDSSHPRIDGTGARVVFASAASDLVADDHNSAQDVFLYDLNNHTLERISADEYALPTTTNADRPALDNFGTIVYERSEQGQYRQVYLYDAQTGSTERSSLSIDASGAPLDNSRPAISADGRYLAYIETSTIARQVVFIDRDTRTTVSVDWPADIDPADADLAPYFSTDGTYILWQAAQPATSAERAVSTDTPIVRTANPLAAATN